MLEEFPNYGYFVGMIARLIFHFQSYLELIYWQILNKKFRKVYMKSASLWTLLLIVCLLLAQTECQYQKVGFLQTTNKITAITSCRIFANTLYTTGDGILHYWVMLLNNIEYTLGGSSVSHQIECSRYAWKLDNSYVAVLDDRGNVHVWREVFEENVVLKSKLINVDFVPTRQSTARDISVDSTYIAVGYQNITANTTQSAIDIYQFYSSEKPTTILFDAPYYKFKLDLKGNLGVFVEEGGNLFFKYYTRSGTILVQRLYRFGYGARISIDYEQGEQGSGNVVSFLISDATQSGFINYTTSNKLTDYQSKYQPGIFPPRLCDHQLSSISLQTNTTILKLNDGIITLAQPITKFMCTTNTTQGQLWSMYYIASVDDKNNYYVDIYWIAKSYHFWAIFGGVIGGICCCACICGCIKGYLEYKKRQERDNYIRANLEKDSTQTF